MRRNLNDLDFGAPIRRNGPGNEVMEVEHEKGMHWHVFMTDQTKGRGSLESMERVEESRKVKRRELNPKNRSETKRKELDEAKVKEWNKVISSGAIKKCR